MNRPLAGCAITGSLTRTPRGFAAIASSLLYQSNTLGMEIEEGEHCTSNASLSFAFKTPHTVPVACEITGWGEPSRQAAVTENIMQAACGLMGVHGRATGKSQPLGLNYLSILTAALALQGTAAASIGQLRGLPVSNSSTSMASAGLLSVGQYIAGATASESPETLLPGHTPHPACLPFVSLDGVIFELETLDAGPWRKFWSEIGVSPAAAGKGWTAFLLRYAKAVAPLPDELRDAISKFSYHCISQMCVRTGMAICPVRTIDDRARDEDCAHVWLQGPWEFSFETSSRNGVSTAAAGNLPLSGFTVIESCRRIQGPLAGHLLALLGAMVIRIEPPGGDPLRGMPPIAEGCSARFDALNRLKTIREIDMKSSAGRAEIKEMVRHADVFLHNWAPGKAVLLNLDHEDLVQINSSLIYAYAGGWATDRAEHSSQSPMPGTDFMAQAYSGVASKIAGASDTRGGSLFTVLDVLGGVVAAQGITIALLNRCMNKAGARVTSSLMSAAVLLCAEDFQELYSPAGAGSISKSIIDEVYETRHGKIAVECCDMATVMRLVAALEAVIDGMNKDFKRSLDGLFLSRTAAQWVEILEQAGVPSAVVVEDLADLQMSAPVQRGLSLGSYTKVNSPWSFG